MINFLKKYSLVIFLSAFAGLIIGFKIFSGDETKLPEESFLPKIEVLEPTPTVVSEPSPAIPTIEPTPTVIDDQMEQILKELNIDIDNPTMEDLGKLFQKLNELENEN